MPYHQSAHTFLLNALTLLLLLALSVSVVRHDGLVEFTQLALNATMVVLKVLGVLHNTAQVFLHGRTGQRLKITVM